ncbi:MAG: hypothetical protein U1E53_21320 [Dongiaceae bacterium]
MKRAALLLVYIVVAVLVGMEVALRLFPAAIPIGLLQHFDPGLRTEIAARIGMETRKGVQAIQRDDGGPPLYIDAPNAVIAHYDKAVTTGPASVQMDERGFCNPPPLAAPPLDVVVLGGSISWCLDVEPKQTWAALLGGELKASVYNLSVKGIGPYEYLQLLKRFGLALHPRVVLFDVSEENDMRDVVRYQRFRAGLGEGDDAGDGQTVLDGNRQGGLLASSSYVWNLGTAALRAWREHRAERNVKQLFPELPPQKSIDYRFVARWGSEQLAFNQDNSNRGQPRYAMALLRGLINLDGYQPALAELAKLARENGFRAVVVYTPTAGTAYARSIVYQDPALTDVMARSSDLQRREIGRMAGELGLGFIDLTVPFQDAAERLRASDALYFLDNMHLSAAGHRVTAEALAAPVAALLKQTAAAQP